MVSGETLPKVVTYSHTASDDNQFRLIETELWLREGNIHCVTNNAKYGDAVTQDASFNTGDVITFQDFNLANLFFINATAGSNTVIYCVGIVMTEQRKRLLEL